MMGMPDLDRGTSHSSMLASCPSGDRSLKPGSLVSEVLAFHILKARQPDDLN